MATAADGLTVAVVAFGLSSAGFSLAGYEECANCVPVLTSKPRPK
jgi:hypothetical protein